jgi:hypothetical protein
MQNAAGHNGLQAGWRSSTASPHWHAKQTLAMSPSGSKMEKSSDAFTPFRFAGR